MEKKIVAVIIAFFLIVNLIPYLFGLWHTPSQGVFLGTVHYATDYFYYLSQVAQGKEQWFQAYNLFTPEHIPALLIGWNYVLLGHLTSLIGIAPSVAYEIGIFGGGLFFLIASYLVLTQIFPHGYKKRILAFILFLFSNTFPRIAVVNGANVFSYYYSWYNYGEPFLRFPAVPHHLMIQGSIFLTILTFLIFAKTKPRFQPLILILSALCGAILATLQPVQWLLLCGALGLVTGFRLVLDLKKKSFSWRHSITNFLPLFVFGAVGSPFVLYLKAIISQIPFLVTSSRWEAAQSPFIPFWPTFLLYFGPVFVLGILSLPFFLKKSNPARLVLFVVGLVSIVSFFSPLPNIMTLLNIRFLSALPVLLAAASATVGIETVSKLGGKFQPLIQSSIITLLLFMLVPLFFIQLNEKLPRDTTNAFLYLPTKVFQVFQKGNLRNNCF